MISPLSGRFRASPDALATRVGEEIVVVHTRTDKIYVLNRTGARVWELVTGDLGPVEIAERLEGEFEVARERGGRGGRRRPPRDGRGPPDRRAGRWLSLASGRENPPPRAADVRLGGSWIVRWDPTAEARPRVLHVPAPRGEAGLWRTPSGSFVVFDGYLFDRGPGDDGRPASDAALVASCHRRFGEQLFERLRGGFAAAVWDEERRQLSVGRDALGLHPCFYWWSGRVLLVAASIDAILARAEVGAAFDRRVIAEYLQNQTASRAGGRDVLRAGAPAASGPCPAPAGRAGSTCRGTGIRCRRDSRGRARRRSRGSSRCSSGRSRAASRRAATASR